MAKWVRSGALDGASALVADLGGRFAPLAASAGLPRQVLRNPDRPIDVAAFARFVDLATQTLACESFGLQLGQLQTFSLFGPLADLFDSAPTIGELLGDLVNFLPLHTQGTIVGLAREGGGAVLNYDLSAEIGQAHRQIVELGFSVFLREVWRHAPDWRPEAVWFRHAPPRDLRWHRRLFGSHVAFNADRNAIFIDPALLAQPTINGDRVAHGNLVSSFRSAIATDPTAFATHVERVVRTFLPFVAIDPGHAARLLNTSRRTLQRRLAASGTHFTQITDAVRADLALSYLSGSELSVAQIAEILQFSQTSALSRAMRRWHGASPRALRQQPF